MDTQYQWIYDYKDETYKCGNENEGCGVFFGKDKWEGNVVIDKKVIAILPQDTRDAAKQECEIELNKHKQEMIS